MKRFLLVFFFSGFISLSISSVTNAQVSLTNGSPSVTIDFSNTMPTTVGTNPSTSFTGAGFEPNPVTPGRLNSNAWATTGFSDGSLAFGGTSTTGDHARGAVSTAQTTGGIYAYTGAPGNPSNPTLMIQPVAADFTPGTLTLRIQNNGTGVITQLAVSYNLYVRNDQTWSNSFNFSYSTDNISYTAVPALDYTSIEALDALGWVLVGSAPSRSTNITSISILPGDYIYIRWSGDDVSGSGSRDEFGLDDISLTATFAPFSTDHFRSATSGNWSNISTWESSADNITFAPATQVPTSLANTITIRNGHTVTINTNQNADQLVIENGGILINQEPASNIFTLMNDPSGDDMDIQSGGMYHVLSAQGYANYQTITAGATIRIRSGGVIRLGDGTLFGGSNNHLLAATTASYIWDNGSIFEWNSQGSFTSSGITYFPDANAATIPVFRTMVNIGTVGAAAATTINGLFEANGNITFGNAGTKTFRNGIIGTGNIAESSSGTFIINGTTASLGGTGSLTVPVTGLQVGATTTVTMITDKTVTGNISILADSYIDLGSFDLTVTGSITIAGVTSYVRTTGAGALTLNNVDSGVSGKLFPVGNSTINPLFISSASTANYSARVVEPITPGIVNNAYAVLRTWYLTSSVSTPGAAISFGYSFPGDCGVSYVNTGPVEVGVNISSIWNVHQTGLTPVAFPLVLGTFAVTTTLPVNYFTSGGPELPFVIANNGAVLPLDYFITARSQKINNNAAVSWNVFSIDNVLNFEVQRSVNGAGFQTIATVNPSGGLQYNYTDANIERGTILYRIRVNRITGGVRYSNTVAIINDSKGLLITSITPNPVQQNAVITLSAARQGGVSFEVYNMAGHKVKRWVSNISEGTNTIQVALNELPSGVYHILAYNLDTRTVLRFIKQ